MCCFLFICDFYQSDKHLWRPKQGQTPDLGVGGEGGREKIPRPLHGRHSACCVEGPPWFPSPLGTRAGQVRTASWGAALFVEGLTCRNRSTMMIMALFALCSIKLSQQTAHNAHFRKYICLLGPLQANAFSQYGIISKYLQCNYFI